MGLIGRLFETLRTSQSSERPLMPGEVRSLIENRKLDDAELALQRLHPDLRYRQAVLDTLKGEIAFHRRQDDEAEAAFRRALADHAGLPDAHYGLSLLFHARGDRESALRHVTFALNRDTSQARFHGQAGLCQLELLNYTRAEKALLQATRLAPEDSRSWNNLGIAQRARGNLRGAAQAFGRAIQLAPTFEAAKSNLEQLRDDAKNAGVDPFAPRKRDGLDLRDADLERIRDIEEAGDYDPAIAACDELLVARYEAPVAAELARLYRAHGDPQSGIDVLRAYLQTRPNDSDATVALAKLLAAEDDPTAEPIVEAALAVRPEDAELWHAMADIRADQDRLQEAGTMYDRAYELQPTFENKARRVGSLIHRCRYEEALEVCNELIAEFPIADGDLIGYRVYALTHLGRHEEVLPVVDQSIEQRPFDPMRRYPRAVIHLLNERFAQGWDDYRFRNLATTRDYRVLPFPEWQGEPLEGKSIVVLAEQGLGDQVMFASCLPDLLALKPRKVWVEAVDRVAPTLARSFPECEVIFTDQGKRMDWVRSLSEVDCYVPIAELPRWFRRSRESFPAHQGYLKPDPLRMAHWRETLDALSPRPKIGVSWRGGLEATRRVLRSMEITALKPLWQAADAEWVCLQYGDVAASLAQAAENDMPIHYWPEAVKDLDDFAALVSQLDLVLTVCNTTVHYAGAVATPTWVLAPKVPEWRYGLKSESMPWYPSTRIWRQDELGQWPSLIERVASALAGELPRACRPSTYGKS